MKLNKGDVMGLKLECGKMYRDRTGKIVTVRKWTEDDGTKDYPFTNEDSSSVYCSNGCFWQDGNYSQQDLIEEVNGVPVLPATTNVLTVLSEVLAERQRQDVKWGPQNHGPMIWLGILAEEFGEAAKDANDFHFAKDNFVKSTKGANFRKELVQVAAVAVAMIESYDKNEGK